MTLATRCAACGTAFRVVQDQLKVANGWVRCGRCTHVFDASGALFEPDGTAAVGGLEHDPGSAPRDTSVAAPPVSAVDEVPTAAIAPDLPDAPAPSALSDEPPHDEPPPVADPTPPGTIWPTSNQLWGTVSEPPAAPAPEPVPEPAPEPPRWLLASAGTTPPVVDIGIGSVLPSPENAAPGDAPPGDAEDGAPPEFVDARFNEDLLAGLPGLRDPADGDDSAGFRREDGPPTTSLGAAAVADASPVGHDTSAGAAAPPPASIDAQPTPSSVEATAPPAAAAAALAVDEPAPSFLRRRGRDDRPWQRRPVRAALGACAALLVLALGLQATLHWRDWIAARWPMTAPWLSAVCATTGCRVQPLRRIDDLGVDSTTLAPALPDSAALRLAIVLSNRGDLPLAAPSVELALTDAGGELVARKVLAPADFHRPAGPLPPGATTRWQTVLLASGERVTGYTVELFYP